MARKRDGFVSIGDLALDLPGAPVRSTPDRYVRRGLASWHGDAFDGKPTASGEPFDSSQFTTAHYDLPFDSRVRVRNLNNVLVPLEALNNGRILDVSYAAARQLEMVEDGVVPIEISASPSLLGTRLRYWPCPGGPSPQHLQCPCPPAASA